MTVTATGPTVSRARLLSMIQGYRDTSLVRTGVTLGVFDALGERPLDAATLAATLGTDTRGLTIFLDALAAVGLVERLPAGYRLAPGAAELLVSTNPGYLGHLTKILASDWEWEALKVLDRAVLHGGAVTDEHAETPNFTYWEDFATHATLATGPTADLIADELAPWMAARESVDVLDVACGHGIYGFRLAQREPRARVHGVDWPNVVAITARNAQQQGLADRVDFITGDMFEVDLAGPHDVALVTNVLHHFSQADATRLLTRAHDALAPGGKLVVVGFSTGDESPAADPAPYLFSLLMLAWTHAGEVHSDRVHAEILADAGFVGARTHTVPGLPLRVFVADRP